MNVRFAMIFVPTLLVATHASAQFGATSGGTSTYGSFGQRSLGGGLSSSSGGLQGGSSQSGFGQSSGMQGGFGSQSGMGGQSGFGQSGFGGQTGGFVGADSGDATNFRSQQGQNQFGQQGLGNMLGQQMMLSQLSRMNRGQQGNTNQQGNSKSKLRIPMRLDADFGPATSATVADRGLERRLRNLPALPSAKKIQVSVQDRTAILQGRVATEREKKLAAGLALLEPGISDVRNELIVDPAASKAEELPRPKAP